MSERLDQISSSLGSAEAGTRTNELGIPKITFTIFYGEHGDVADAQKIKAYFEQCDIFILEGIGWTRKDLEVENAVSAGTLTPEEATVGLGKDPAKNPFGQQILEMTYRSKKPIAYIDYSADDERSRDQRSASGSLSIIPLYWASEISFRDKIERVKKNLRNFAQSNQIREKDMVSALKPVISQTIADNSSLLPKARQQGQLNVLLLLGSMHTAIFHSLEGAGYEVSREFSSKPYVYPYYVEGIRRYRFGKAVNDDLAARIFIEMKLAIVFDQELQNAFPQTYQQYEFLRKVISRLSYQDIEAIAAQDPKGKSAKVQIRQALFDKIPDKMKGVLL